MAKPQKGVTQKQGGKKKANDPERAPPAQTRLFFLAKIRGGGGGKGFTATVGRGQAKPANQKSTGATKKGPVAWGPRTGAI